VDGFETGYIEVGLIYAYRFYERGIITEQGEELARNLSIFLVAAAYKNSFGA
jgi:hypothetical protein